MAFLRSLTDISFVLERTHGIWRVSSVLSSEGGRGVFLLEGLMQERGVKFRERQREQLYPTQAFRGTR